MRGKCRALKTSSSVLRSGENQAVGDEETLTKTKKFTTWRKSVNSKAIEETVYFDKMATNSSMRKYQVKNQK